MWPFSRQPTIPVLRFTGPIGMATPLRPGLSLASYAGAIDKAFALSKLPGLAVVINSPGGSPVQSNLIFKRLRQMAAEKKKKIYVFCEDVAWIFPRHRRRRNLCRSFIDYRLDRGRLAQLWLCGAA